MLGNLYKYSIVLSNMVLWSVEKWNTWDSCLYANKKKKGWIHYYIFLEAGTPGDYIFL